MDILDLAQVALTAVASLTVLFLLTKLIGNKQLSQMTMFDYVTGITIGSIAAEMATELETPVRPLVAMLVYGVLTFLIALWTNKSLAARRTFTGKPLLLFDKGVIYRDHLKKARLDLSEFLTLCRIAGYFDLEQVETAVLEHNGIVSFLPKAQYRPAEPNDFQLKPQQDALQTPVILDGHVMPRNLKSVGKDETWLTKQLHARGYHDAGEVLLALCDNSGADAKLYPLEPKKPAGEVN